MKRDRQGNQVCLSILYSLFVHIYSFCLYHLASFCGVLKIFSLLFTYDFIIIIVAFLRSNLFPIYSFCIYLLILNYFQSVGCFSNFFVACCISCVLILLTTTAIELLSLAALKISTNFTNATWFDYTNCSIHAIQDPSHYYFAKNNDRFIQSDDLNEDFGCALLNLYEI